MKVRNAKTTDVEAIHALITHYAQLDRMLFRSKAYIFDNLQMFSVAVIGKKIVGCCALQVVWANLAEIKSLAVACRHRKKGIGSALVKNALKQAKELDISRVFALTLEPDFFEKLGFSVVGKKTLPMKVWSDCAKCSKQDNCDETAVELIIES
jgi:amino-acid N-acetyltransferase